MVVPLHYCHRLIPTLALLPLGTSYQTECSASTSTQPLQPCPLALYVSAHEYRLQCITCETSDFQMSNQEWSARSIGVELNVVSLDPLDLGGLCRSIIRLSAGPVLGEDSISPVPGHSGDNPCLSPYRSPI